MSHFTYLDAWRQQNQEKSYFRLCKVVDPSVLWMLVQKKIFCYSPGLRVKNSEVSARKTQAASEGTCKLTEMQGWNPKPCCDEEIVLQATSVCVHRLADTPQHWDLNTQPSVLKPKLEEFWRQTVHQLDKGGPVMIQQTHLIHLKSATKSTDAPPPPPQLINEEIRINKPQRTKFSFKFSVNRLSLTFKTYIKGWIKSADALTRSLW